MRSQETIDNLNRALTIAQEDMAALTLMSDAQRDHIRRLENRPLTLEVEHYSQRLAFAETFIASIGVNDHYNWVRSLADERG